MSDEQNSTTGVSRAPLPFAQQDFARLIPDAAAPSGFALERRVSRPRSANTALDWLAFALAFLVAPLGLLLGIVAAVLGVRNRGYAVSLAKAAIAIGAVLSLVLGVAIAVQTKVSNDNAAHAAAVASSAAWCSKLLANPATLSSGTFGWPAPAGTIPESVAAIQKYESRWASLARVAPRGVRADTQKVADTAKSIAVSVQSTLTLDDANNVAQLQNVVATSGIPAWASTYCS